MATVVTSAVKLGRRIRQLRMERGLSQEDLAEPEYSGAYISHVENGKRHASLEALTHIAGRLGLTYDQLVSGRDPNEDLRLDIAIQQAIAQVHTGDPEGATRALRAAADQATVLGHSRGVQRAEEGLGLSLYRLGRLEEAFSAFERAETAGTSMPVEELTAARVGKARCLWQLGEVHEARHILESHLIELKRREQPDPTALVATQSALIPINFEAGYVDRAKDAVRDAGRLEAEATDPEQRACLYVNRAQLFLIEGQRREALTSLALAEEIYRELGWHTDSIKVSLSKSLVMQDDGDLEGAEQVVRFALEDESSLGASDRAIAHTQLAQLRRRQGDAKQGLELAKKAIKLSAEALPDVSAEANREAGLCAAELDDGEMALRYWRKALKLYKRTDHHEDIAKTASLIGDHLIEAGDVNAATAAYREGLGAMGELR